MSLMSQLRNRLMKVSVVQPRLPYYRVPFFNRLAEPGHLQLTVLHTGAADYPREVEFKEIRVRQLEVGGLNYQCRLRKLVYDAAVVVLPLNVRGINNVLLTLGRQSYRVIYWGQGLGRSTWANHVRHWMVQRASAAVFYSEEGKNMFEALGVPSRKLFVAPNTLYVPNASFEPNIKRHTFLFIGRLQRRKRIDELLRAFAEVKEDLPRHVTVEIVGTGAIRKDLERLARHLGIRNSVTFWGRIVDHKQLKAICQRALAYVSPGAVGLGLLHSFAYGVPVVTRRNGDHGPEVNNLTDGINGRFYEGTVSQLGVILKEITENPTISRRLGESAFIHFKRERSLDKMVAGFREALDYTLA